MKKYYHYLFYKIYVFMLNTQDRENVFTGTIVYLSISIFFYLLSIDIFLDKIISIKLLTGNLYLLIGLFVAFLIYFLNEKYFKLSDRYLNIKSEFDNENEKQKTIGNIIVLITTIGSVLLFFGVGYISNKLQ